jgi:integrase
VQWREEVLKNFKPSSAQAGKSHLDCHILPKLGNLRLEQLGPENQQKFVNSLAGCSRKTVLNILSTMSSMRGTAEQWGYATRKVEPSRLRLPDRSDYVPSCFNRKQVEDILSIVGEPWRTFFVVLALSGMRAGEVLGLQWPDIDWERSCIHIRRSAWCGKTNSTKTKSSAAAIPMPDKLTETLRTYREIWKANLRGFLFATRNGRPPSSNKVVEYQLHPPMYALGIPHEGVRFGLHAFRHGVASMLADLGYTVEVSQKQLRHSNARTTLNYTHVGKTVVGEAMNHLAESLNLDAVAGLRASICNKRTWVQFPSPARQIVLGQGPERQSQHRSEFPDTATKSRCAVPCTNRAFVDNVEASGIGSEREADSPVCWKQWKCERVMERLE